MYVNVVVFLAHVWIKSFVRISNVFLRAKCPTHNCITPKGRVFFEKLTRLELAIKFTFCAALQFSLCHAT
jgi:hypothetical protein